MKKLKYIFLMALMVMSFNATAKPVVGEAVPDFSAVDIEGKRVELSEMKDKLVVLEWNNPNCPFVHKHYDEGNMQALQKKYMAVGITWIVINSSASGNDGFFNNNEEAKEILNQRKSTPSNYIRDMSGEIGHLYGAATTPHMFIINKGKLVYMGAIDSIPSGDKADIAKATNYVAQALDEILASKPVSTPVTQQYGCKVKYAN